MGKKSILQIFLMFILMLTLTSCSSQKEEANSTSKSIETSDAAEDLTAQPMQESSQEPSSNTPEVDSKENETNLQNTPSEIQNKPQTQEVKNPIPKINAPKPKIKNTNNVLNNQPKNRKSISRPVQKPCQHNFVEISKSAPSCTDSGTQTLRCNHCGITRSEKLPPLGHMLGKYHCDETKHFRKCSRCGMTESENHILHDEVCTVCKVVIFAD